MTRLLARAHLAHLPQATSASMQRFRSRGLLLGLLCLALSAPVSAQNTGTRRSWPFGSDPSKGGLASFTRYDLYNLGVLGAKARDEAKPLPKGRSSGRRSFRGGRDKGGDGGPSRLFVELLFPEGPAEKADLRVGDVIVGVRKKNFGKDDSLGAIAAAITKLRAKGKRVLDLRIERDGKVQTLSVELPPEPKTLGKPISDAGRRDILMPALAFLAKQQGEDGGFPSTLAGNTGVCVQTSLAGLAWLSAGSTQREGQHAPNVTKSLKFLMRQLGAKSPFPRSSERGNMDQTTWAWAYAGMFLGELQLREPTVVVKKELQRIADSLVERQEKSGGWAHGPGGPNMLDYLELNIQAGLVLQALGLARQAGCAVDEDAVKRAADYIQASSNGDGGVGYSERPGQKGSGNIGRTAGCYLGFKNLGLTRHPFFGKMQSWTRRNAQGVMGGHASLMQHITLAGLGAQALGGRAERAYWKTMERDLVLAQAPDGSLQPRPWHESLLMESNSDVSVGQIWTTASWAIVLGAKAPKGKKDRGLPGLLAKLGKRGRN